ncbi:MAG: hypothetical protein IJV03_03065 [Alphaproteobacteria bacterium]|nr:hypothetical protein [Alphaproteobacteria bacterium]
MEQFKSFDDYPIVPSKIFTPENLAQYDNYMKEAIRQSQQMEINALIWARQNVIYFHNGR